MKIALLGLGKEGHATKTYFKSHYPDATFETFQNLAPEDFQQIDYSSYDIIFRSPSIPPTSIPESMRSRVSSVTKYFFDHCPCPIIGVTATKGKGTTCTIIKSLLEALSYDVHLVGNIGLPALEALDALTPDSVVVYELSSFQLWDLDKSPHVAVLGVLEPDHLNVHRDYADYLEAKSHITMYQTSDDYLIYYSKNPETAKIASKSKARQIPYPFPVSAELFKHFPLLGQHNQNNACAAIAAVASFLNISPDEYLKDIPHLTDGLRRVEGLPHRLEYLNTIDGVAYYDDNFATNVASTKVALEAFDEPLVLILGGRDKTEYQDLPELYQAISRQNIKSIILLGESGHELAKRYGMSDERFILVESLSEAVDAATESAKDTASTVVLMSPAAASFDMFQDVYDRGAKYQQLINALHSQS